MSGIRRSIVLLAAASGIAAHPAFSQSTAPASLDSYRKARAVLDASIAAHGGEGPIRAIEDVTVAFDGRRHMEYQSFSLARPWDVMPNEWTLVLDVKNSRLRRDGVERYPKDFAFTGRQVLTPEGGWWMDPTRRGTGDALGKIGREAFAGARNSWRREVPVLLLAGARDRAASLRSLGAVTESGKRYDAITFAEDGAQITLLFDAASKLLARYEAVRDDAIVGDQTAAVAFSDYRPVGGIQLPGRRAEMRNGGVVREGTLTYAVNTHPHDSLFATPTGYAEEAKVAAEEEQIRKLAENVWLLQALPGGNRVMFVAFNDYVLVFEAPTPQAAAVAVMDAVRKTVPGKPIRYVTFSHHHDDHGGGLRPYIANGFTIVTTPKNRPFVQQVAAATHTIAPDTLSRAPRPPVIETFSGKRVFTDGSMTVELHELGPNSHVDEMVLAWLPRERLIFQGDLIIPPRQGELPPANTLTREFLAKIDAMRWDAETIAGVHGRVMTLAELREMVSKRVAAH